jgi:hypothetical protein
MLACAELSWLPNLARVLPHPVPRALAALALHLGALTLFEGARPWRELAGAARALRGGQS